MNTCKCGASNVVDHLARVANGYSPHTYTGSCWSPTAQQPTTEQE